MNLCTNIRKLTLVAVAVASLILAGQASAADSIKGQVLGGGAPIAQSTVTLWAASAGEPKQLAETKTDNEGRFELSSSGASVDSSLYLVATGGEPQSSGWRQQSAIALLAVVGSTPSTTRRDRRDDDYRFGGDPYAVHRQHSH